MDLSNLIIWTSQFLILRVSCQHFQFYSILHRNTCKQTVLTMIRCCKMWHLNWVCTVCICPQNWCLVLKGFRVLLAFPAAPEGWVNLTSYQVGEYSIINPTFISIWGTSYYWSAEIFSVFHWTPSIGKSDMTPVSFLKTMESYIVCLCIIPVLPTGSLFR